MGSSANASFARHEVVSSEAEQLILVDENDNEIGFASKGEAHDGDGILHRAFSLFIFDDDGRLLLQQRSGEKRLWGGFWSNSCCSHPRRGEIVGEAVHRRLEQELGMTAELQYVYKFQYQADFGQAGAEHELCHVYVGKATSPVQANRSEIDDWRWVTPTQLSAAIDAEPQRYTPWFKQEWKCLTGEHSAVLAELRVSL